jgi:SAM-dependent methyltransferase
MTSCPVCCSRKTRVFDRRERVSLLQNRLYGTAEAARHAPTVQVVMTACADCSFVWNAAFDPGLMKYDPSYENDQSNSDVFKHHLQERVARILDAAGDGPGRHIVEVGCGQGDFLALLASAPSSHAVSLTGFDPAWRGTDSNGPGGSRIFRSMFSTESARALQTPPDAVVSRHTIEHVSDPVGFLTAIRDACAGRKVRIFLETPCVNWILENLQFQDFFYEHCSIFTTASLQRALRQAGLFPGRIEHVFGGQYLWAEAFSSGAEQQPLLPVPELAVDRWSDAKSRFVAMWIERIEAAAKKGPVFVWGVGAKGVTFSQLTDPQGTLLAGAVDVNPKKQSRYIPLTGLGVIAPRELPVVPFTAIVMNPNYFDEIAVSLKATGRTATLVSVAE